MGGSGLYEGVTVTEATAMLVIADAIADVVEDVTTSHWRTALEAIEGRLRAAAERRPEDARVRSARPVSLAWACVADGLRAAIAVEGLPESDRVRFVYRHGLVCELAGQRRLKAVG